MLNNNDNGNDNDDDNNDNDDNNNDNDKTVKTLFFMSSLQPTII